MSHTFLLWFRHDLRVTDHPALLAAIDQGASVVPVFIWDPQGESAWPPGEASKWWLHHSLCRLDESLRQLGSRLVIRSGDSTEVLRDLIAETGAKGLCWHRRYEPDIIARDRKIKESLRRDGLIAKSFNGSLLFEPWDVETKDGKPYQVFTPFWRNCRGKKFASPRKAPASIPAPDRWPLSQSIDSLNLLPKRDWAREFSVRWQPGEAGAETVLDEFICDAIETYTEDRDRPDLLGTSSLSPHLHFGEISPRQIWQRVVAEFDAPPATGNGKDDGPWTFLSEIGWREFSHHVLYHFPETPQSPLRKKFAEFPWSYNKEHLRAWQHGLTGYPIVDAGMRELWTTGWMHNRVRMIVASFLTKHLRLSWQEGSRWFWNTLVDADLANNTMGWQWAAGCGADAAPYFRIFNPILQGKKFDPDGEYVRDWVPELAKLDPKWIHTPWKATGEALSRAGITLGKQYPRPIVDHSEAREAALKAFEKVKS